MPRSYRLLISAVNSHSRLCRETDGSQLSLSHIHLVKLKVICISELVACGRSCIATNAAVLNVVTYNRYAIKTALGVIGLRSQSPLLTFLSHTASLFLHITKDIPGLQNVWYIAYLSYKKMQWFRDWYRIPSLGGYGASTGTQDAV